MCIIKLHCLHSVVDSRHICLLLLLKTVVNCNVASASVSLHTFSFMALCKFVFNFNFNTTIVVFSDVWWSSYRVCTVGPASVRQRPAVCTCSHFLLFIRVSCSILVSRWNSVRGRSNQHDGDVLRLRMGVACRRHLMRMWEFDLRFTYTKVSAVHSQFFAFFALFARDAK